MADDTVIDPIRRDKLGAIIKRLHQGEAVDVVRKDFARLIEGVSATEIAAMEQSLIEGGMPVEEVQRLCDVHVQLFQGELSKGAKAHGMPGHPLHSYLAENRAAKARIARLLREARGLAWGIGNPGAARMALDDLARFIVHYERKENQLFPWLERKGFTGPSKVMWGKHDEIRSQFKAVDRALRDLEKAASASDRDAGKRSARAFRAEARNLAGRMRRMTFMEERILFPNALSRLSDSEWAEIRRGEDSIGFAWIEPGAVWDPAFASAKGPMVPGAARPAPTLSELVASAVPGKYDEPARGADSTGNATVELHVGALPAEVVDLILRRIPIDLSFVDVDDKVAWYSDGPHRIFPRSPGVIGRDVRNCHPPKSLDVVERILSEFRNGTKDSARFWIEMGGKFIIIEYFAVRGEDGSYLGTLEASQDATEIRGLQGQRRLLDWTD